MGNTHGSSGPNNVPMYQMSGIPFISSGTVTSGSATKITFPYVTKDIYIRCRSTNVLSIGFSLSGSLGTFRTTLEDNEYVTFNVRTKALFLSGISGSVFYEVVAGLTMISANEFPELSASANFLGIG